MVSQEQLHPSLDLLTCSGDTDSNVLVMPAKKNIRNAKEKGIKKEQGKLKQPVDKKLSKSQKRKLKKLEDGKAKSLLLSKTYETLAYALLKRRLISVYVGSLWLLLISIPFPGY
ncbi:hypothetical protein QQ045_033265 [Rhodiola kirilowii]